MGDKNLRSGVATPHGEISGSEDWQEDEVRYLLSASLVLAGADDDADVETPAISSCGQILEIDGETLYSFRCGNQQYYPGWQFCVQGDDVHVLPGLGRVLGALPESMHPLSVDYWFCRPNDDLVLDGMSHTPVEWLRADGDIDAVILSIGTRGGDVS